MTDRNRLADIVEIMAAVMRRPARGVTPFWNMEIDEPGGSPPAFVLGLQPVLRPTPGFTPKDQGFT